VVCLIAGLLSNVFDGIVARRLGVATAALRRLDCAVDVVFYLAVLWTAAVVYPEVIWAYAPGLGAVLGLEVVCQGVSFLRAGRPPATHAYSAKCWGLLLFAAFVALLGFGGSRGIMKAMLVVGCLADVEVIAIMLVAPPPAVDVPSLWHAWCLRRRCPENGNGCGGVVSAPPAGQMAAPRKRSRPEPEAAEAERGATDDRRRG
jgi:CDP-diacylglycerol--glycerol-3-phosphate 3-phosphatidyltransferase